MWRTAKAALDWAERMWRPEERSDMNSQPSAADAGTIDVGGDLTVNRIGFGAMRITGPGVWGGPPDEDLARAALRRAVELDVTLIDTATPYGPEVRALLVAD